MKAIVMYLPIIHAGHLEVFQRQKPTKLYVLGKSLIKEFPKLERDIRALPPELVAKQMQTLGFVDEVSILEKENVDQLSAASKIVLMNDEVGRGLYDKYLNKMEIEWDTTFLRWNSMNAVTKNLTNPDRKISSEEFDKLMMEVAYTEADKSSDWWRHVGAVLVKDGKIVFSNYNSHAVTENAAYIEGEPRSNFDAGKAIADLVIFQHGEATLIAQAAKEGISTKEADMYVTTFPCPSCAMSMANAGIGRVFYKEGYSLLDAERILKQVGTELIQVVYKEKDQP